MVELIKKLQEEIALLELELRIELPREILKARAHGDLSENAEYHAAKERQRYVQARLSQLATRLRDLSMIDMTKIPHDRIGLGSTVVVLDIDERRADSLQAGDQRGRGRSERVDLHQLADRARPAGQAGGRLGSHPDSGRLPGNGNHRNDDDSPSHGVLKSHDVHPRDRYLPATR